MSDLLDRVASEVNEELSKEKASVEFHTTNIVQLEKVLDAIGNTSNGNSAPAVAAPTTAKKSRRGKAGRRKGSGKRAAEALEYVTANPGITIKELSDKMNVATTYLYRVLPGLEKEKKVKKDKASGGYNAV